jgi:transcriptional regulator with XRE-family HTH domain
MPIRPKFVHPVRALRTAARLTQPQFAKLFGVSASYVQAIELGERQINDDLAYAMMTRFGASPRSLKKKRGRPKMYSRRATIQERIEEWAKIAQQLNDDILTVLSNVMIPKLIVLSEAARRKRKGPALAISLDRWLAAAERDYSLHTTREAVLEEFREAHAEVDFVPFAREISGRPVWRVNKYGPPPTALQMIRDNLQARKHFG